MSARKTTTTPRERNRIRESSLVYPFAAIVGQDEMKLALILNVIDPSIGGVLIMGHRGTGKSTAVRGLADLLPERWVAKGCNYQCDPADPMAACNSCRDELDSGRKLPRVRARVPVTDLPLGATEDRVCGSIDIQRALADGVKAFEPGLLARANRGFLYIDEVNLLEDHLVDLLLDVAATGENKVERESISIAHPARFVLIGSGNPEEGELRPQLLDRFGLSVEVKTEVELEKRVEIVERRQAYDESPFSFVDSFAAEQSQLRKRITAAQKHFGSIKIGRGLLHKIAELCAELQIDGHRGELTITRAARALAAFSGKKKVGAAEVRQVAAMAVRHRLRRDPLEETADSERIQQAVERTFPETRAIRHGSEGDDGEGGGGAISSQTDPSRTGIANDRRRLAQAGSPESAAAETPSLPHLKPKETSREISQLPLRKGKPTHLRARSNGRASDSVTNYARGRYVRATPLGKDGSRVAFDATLRAIALNKGRAFSRENLRYKELSSKSGRLFIFAIDTSGSMAQHRIKQAKLAALRLLKQSYVKRDQVAIVGFREDSAELLLPASRSILRARRVLDSLRVGGSTPLSAGLVCALKLAKRVRTRVGQTAVLLFTHGNANIPLSTAVTTDRFQRQTIIDRELQTLGGEFLKANVPIAVMDTQNAFIRSGNAQAIARLLHGRYRLLP